MKAAVLAVLVAAGFVAQVGAANTAVFYVRSLQLEQALWSAEADGVPGSALTRSRASLRALEWRWAGTLPYATVSGAALEDPFADVEAQAGREARRARAAARSRAEAALLQLRDAAGPNDPAYYDGLVALGAARTPVDYARLAVHWQVQADRTRTLRDRLAASSGGLTGGLPADVVQRVARLQALAAAAVKSGVSSDPAWETSAEAQLYLSRTYSAQLDQHAAVMARLTAAITTLDQRVNARQLAESALARIPELLPQALSYGIGDEYAAQAEELKKSFSQARGDDDLVRIAGTADVLYKELDAANQGRLPLNGIACMRDAPSKLIVIHLATQQLVAYENGCPYLRTPVTTGRPALRTERGTFHIFLKSRTWHMVSQWPKGSAFYYPPTWVYNAMEFIGDGTFIHNADWQPDSSYGRGSENGPYSSHGCVHVIDGPLAQLYDWAAIGTTVVVGD